MSIGAHKYVAFTTFRKDGSPRSVPVWIAELDDGTVGFTTSSGSWKVKRLANDRRVSLQQSDSRGRAIDGSEEVAGTAVVVKGDEALPVKQAIVDKYRWQFRLIQIMASVRARFGGNSQSDCAIIVTLSGSETPPDSEAPSDPEG